ncbi:MAG TPA: ATP-binding protein [Steroidobacteraceae bacterium]|nr:ATP-binding protein [Steroidobacteraceae bacterium]
MSSVSASSPAERAAFWRSLRPWPQSLFGRLFASVLAAMFVAQAITFTLVARERTRFVAEGNVREWSRRIADLTYALQLLDPEGRVLARARLERWPPERLLGRSEPDRLAPPATSTASSARDFRDDLERQLRSVLGPRYAVSVMPTRDLGERAINVTRQSPQAYESGGRLYDVRVGLPDGDALTFRVAQGRRAPVLPRTLIINLIALTVAAAAILFVFARSITRPLSDLARAAEAVGKDLSEPPIAERGSYELKEAARAFNTMQDRMRRYLDSRSRVLAAMSHDLKTPLTRMRLRVETLDDAHVRERFGRDLDEMEGMVHGTLSLLKGLRDDEQTTSVDVDALLQTLRSEFAELGASVEVRGRARGAIRARPQALKRCLTNLISNAINFGVRAHVIVEDGAALTIRVQDEGSGIASAELERVFEPFYRIESSRNRDTGGTGLGLSIARDIAQGHGGSLVLRNLAEHGLEAILTLPRVRRG